MPTGGCLRDHLLQVKDMTGTTPPELLIGCPEGFGRAWTWFLDLNRKRQIQGGMQVIYLPITYSELEAWSRYTGNRPSFLERWAIDVLDRAYLTEMNKGT